MRRRISFTPCIPFHTSGSFARHHVRPCTADTGILNRFVCIQCHSMLRSCFHYLLIMVDSILSMMWKPVRESSCITCFQDVDAVVGIPLHCMNHLPFIVRDISSCFMVSNDFDSFFLGITYYFIYVKVSVRFRKIKILHTAPTFPTFIPAFKQYRFYIIGSSEVDIFFGIDSGSTVAFIHFPSLYTQMHPPPYTDIFQRTNPISSFQHTRVIQVQDQGRID